MMTNNSSYLRLYYIYVISSSRMDKFILYSKSRHWRGNSPPKYNNTRVTQRQKECCMGFRVYEEDNIKIVPTLYYYFK